MSIKIRDGGAWVDVAGAGLAPDSTISDLISVSGGTISANDAGADRIWFWDDSASKATHLSVGTGLQITGTTLSASGGGFDFSGLEVYEENSSVGTGFTALKFIGNSITAADGGNGIANITVSVNYSDISNTPTIPTDISDLTDTGGAIPTDISDLTDTGGAIPTDISDLTDTGGAIPTDTGDLTNNAGFIDGITIKDEGSPLPTKATILNFVGSGVVASGTGAEKTITISGGGGNVTVTQTGYSCDNPITTSGSTINIASTSNAYGTRYVENYLPLSSDGCDGDLWYYTAGSGTSPFVGWTYYASNPVSLSGSSTTISSLPNNLKAIRIIFENVGWNSNANNDLLVELDSSVLWNFKTFSIAVTSYDSWSGANDGFGIYRPGSGRYYFGTMELYRSEGSTSQSRFWVGKHQVVSTDFGTEVAYRHGAGVAYPNQTGNGQPTSIVFKAHSNATFSGNSKVHLYYITD